MREEKWGGVVTRCEAVGGQFRGPFFEDAAKIHQLQKCAVTLRLHAQAMGVSTGLRRLHGRSDPYPEPLFSFFPSLSLPL